MALLPARTDVSRRTFLKSLGATMGALGAFAVSPSLAAAQKNNLIKNLEPCVIINGRRNRAQGADAGAWFHPRACVLPTPEGLLGLMTCQRITGSDYYHPVSYMTSSDLGRTWGEPEAVPGMGRQPADSGKEVGVCDVVPEYHAPTNTVLAMGHNVFYEKGRFFREQPPRCPVYSVRDVAGNWSPLAKLVWDDPRGSEIYTCGCSQRFTLPDGDLLVPLSFVPKGQYSRMVTTARCGYDGRKLEVKKTGNTLRIRKKDRLLEPSITRFDGRFWITMRSDDNRGYVAVSEDGMQWRPQKPWTWDDGTPLTMSTTQQHWLTHSDGLFLVYTRKAKNNTKVFRWRAPLFLAQVDPKRMCLVRETEQVVFPLIGDGIRKGKHVARMGNFHVNPVTPNESWITVGEALPEDGFRGDTLLAHVTWNCPNGNI